MQFNEELNFLAMSVADSWESENAKRRQRDGARMKLKAISVKSTVHNFEFAFLMRNVHTYSRM